MPITYLHNSMNNYEIADHFSLLSKLMDIHRENSFKAKSYSSSAFTIEKLPVQLSEIERGKIFGLKGIGESAGQKIIELLDTGKLEILNDYLSKTPPGVIEMLNIKGLGPKKVANIWHDMEIETIGELLYACNENRLTLFKGFGEKTQQTVKESLEFYLGTKGSFLYQQLEKFATNVTELLNKYFNVTTLVTGAFRRQLEVIEVIEWVTLLQKNELINFWSKNNYQIIDNQSDYISFKGQENILLGFYLCSEEDLFTQLFATSCSNEFLDEWINITGFDLTVTYHSEEDIFEDYSSNYIPAFQREDKSIIHEALNKSLPDVIVENDIKGIIHSHSNWSDGVNTIEEMAKACIDKGLEYLVISDHSKTAAYAQGLSVERILAQHAQIDELNKKFFPFKIFKSIESDILADGSLDYEPEILNRFDIVIASIHSNLNMQEDKAMMRLMNAIENPFTSIIGHLTGRLLLSRSGYPINHLAIIDACKKNNVAIELNAHPRRLDIDWRFIKPTLNKNVLISINPDAHSTEGFNDCKYGILVAQKAGLTKQQNLSSFNLQQFEEFVQIQKLKRK